MSTLDIPEAVAKNPLLDARACMPLVSRDSGLWHKKGRSMLRPYKELRRQTLPTNFRDRTLAFESFRVNGLC